MIETPTAEQIHAYLLANGWHVGESGSAAYLMVAMGRTVRMLHESTERDRGEVVFQIALAERRRPTDVRLAILAHGVEVETATDRPVAPQRPRLFRLERDVDCTGVSGPGHVADGVVWPDGAVTLRWLGARASTVCWTDFEHVVAVHGHDGATRFEFDDAAGGADDA